MISLSIINSLVAPTYRTGRHKSVFRRIALSAVHISYPTLRQRRPCHLNAGIHRFSNSSTASGSFPTTHLLQRHLSVSMRTPLMWGNGMICRSLQAGRCTAMGIPITRILTIPFLLIHPTCLQRIRQDVTGERFIFPMSG